MGILLQSVFAWLFGCHHYNISRVFTIQGRTYQVCWDCGAEFDYSWERMHRSQLPTPLRVFTRTTTGGTYLDMNDLVHRTSR